MDIWQASTRLRWRVQDPAGQDFHLGVMLPPADRDNPDAKGVTITAVDPSGLVARQGLERKDVKLNVNGSAVSNPGEVRQALVLAAVEVARTGGSSEVLRAALTGPPVTLGESFSFQVILSIL